MSRAASRSLSELNLYARSRKCRVTDQFVLFYQGPLSQFYSAPMKIEGESFFCCEQWMMAGKARLFKDEAVRAQIMRASKPAQCKKLGRMVSGFNQKEWDKHKYQMVLVGNLAKFTQNKDLQSMLLKLGESHRTFVEAAPRDRIWGIGMSVDDSRADDSANWKGQNLLGKAITEARDEILKIHAKASSESSTD